MTREEAIQILRTRIVPTRNWQEIHEAIDMAIEALSQVRCNDCKWNDDVVEVVRCKDCRHRCKEPIYSKADVHWVIYQIGDCPIICKTVGDDDFCSFGELAEQTERREE